MGIGLTPAPGAGGGGGGASEQSFYDSGNDGNGFTVGDTATASAPWANVSGAELLDLTDPDHPAVVAAGVYAVNASVAPDSTPTVDGAIALTVSDGAGGNTYGGGIISPSNAATATANVTCQIPAGSTLNVLVRNNEDTEQTYYLNATVTKLS